MFCSTAVSLDEVEIHVTYKSPELKRLGTLAELTLGNNGSVLDKNGKGSKKAGDPD